ncbi:3-hydroxyisobutyrate dehydrogenase [Acidilobus saccharovorans 345-15]|uniref:3-hydroxyisobutyrate dehydrogenase n=1 Tax=Acidilobus saccharovorans (strain DSM 16705 / JCM 18335 / VKM B-2471 / 345-15) TaxID=666510 RepID=D9Q2A6_ACIS3|nr:3-hydroxyisobutyrate dehydrogenase [Acidilobus saccharovorans 345-15]
MMARVGVIGLGVMGYRVAANLAKAGLLAGVYNRTRARAEDFRRSYPQVEVFATPSDLADRVDYIITVLSDDNAVSAVVGNLLPHLRGKVLIDMSTISPTTSVSLAKEVSNVGGVMFDAPMMGTSVDVEQKRITVLVGGPKDRYAEVEPILSATSGRVVYVGPNGMGLYMKLAGNMIFAIFMNGLAEAINFALRAGLSPDQIIDLFLNISGTRSPSSSLKVPKMLNSDYSVQFALKHMRKDTEIMIREAQKLGVPVPLTSLASNMFRMSEGLGLGDFDVSAIAEFYRKLSQQR